MTELNSKALLTQTNEDLLDWMAGGHISDPKTERFKMIVQIKMMNQLIESLNQNSESSSRLASRLNFLTGVIAFATVLVFIATMLAAFATVLVKLL